MAIAHGGPAGADTRTGATTAPLRKLNPAPTQAYEIRLILAQVADLPAGADRQAPFAEVAGTAQFDVGNAAGCGKSDPRIGQVPTLSSHEPFRMTRVSATEYVGTIHADQLVDEDYYGRGVCHWKLTEVRVALRAGTDPADTRFVSALAARQVLPARRRRATSGRVTTRATDRAGLAISDARTWRPFQPTSATRSSRRP
ncbi:hypothetical protein WJ972_06020 [Achromobacter insuavis]